MLFMTKLRLQQLPNKKYLLTSVLVITTSREYDYNYQIVERNHNRTEVKIPSMEFFSILHSYRFLVKSNTNKNNNN